MGAAVCAQSAAPTADRPCCPLLRFGFTGARTAEGCPGGTAVDGAARGRQAPRSRPVAYELSRLTSHHRRSRLAQAAAGAVARCAYGPALLAMMIIMSMLALQLFCHLSRISLRHFESTAPGPNVHAAEEVDLGSDLKDWDRLNDVSLMTACSHSPRVSRRVRVQQAPSRAGTASMMCAVHPALRAVCTSYDPCPGPTCTPTLRRARSTSSRTCWPSLPPPTALCWRTWAPAS